MDLIDKLTNRDKGASLRGLAASDHEEQILEALDASDLDTRDELQRRAEDLKDLKTSTKQSES